MYLFASPFFFVPLLAATMVVGTFVFAYASHCFLTVVDQTSAGNDEVVWPNDPMYDWLWEGVYMLWLTALWLGPIVLALRAASDPAAGWHVLFVGAALVWLFFPVTLLSSMSASSRWVLLSPRLVARLYGQRSGSLLLFYLHSAPVLAVAAVLFQWLYVRPGAAGLALLTGPALAAVLFIYARQLGRLAHLVEHTRGRAAPPPRAAPRRRPRAAAAAHNPWTGSAEENRPPQPRELPPVMTPFEGPVVGYDVQYGDRPAQPEPPPPPKRRPPDLDDVPYELEGSPDVDPPRGPLPPEWAKPSEYEMRLATRGAPPPPPSHPWAVGVYNFPLYRGVSVPLVMLAAGLGALGLMIHTLMVFKP